MAPFSRCAAKKSPLVFCALKQALGEKRDQVMEFKTERIRWLAICLVLFVSPIIFLALKDGEIKLALIFMLIFGLPIIYLYIFCAKVQITEESIIAKYSFGEFKLKWSEINKLSVGGGNLKLISPTKTITIPSYEFWSGANRQEAILLFNDLVAKHGVKMAGAYLALIPTFKASKNA